MKYATTIIAILATSLAMKGTAKVKNILFMPAMGAPSHVKSMIPLAENLVKDGHNISLVQYYNEKREKVTHDSIQFIYVLISGMSLMSEKDEATIWRTKGLNRGPFFKSSWSASTACHRSRHAENHSDFYKKLSTLNWDLLIVDSIFQPCGMIFCVNTKNQAWIDYSTTLMFQSVRRYRASSVPSCAILSMSADSYQPSNFRNRLFSVVDDFAEQVFWFIINAHTIMLERFEDFVFSIEHTNAFYTNAVYSLGSLSPMLEVPLPQTMSTFSLDYACPKALSLSNEYKTISSTFEHLPQYRIVWQFNGNLNSLSNNSHLKLEPWIPLPSLLQHPKTVLFITHSGMKSFREAICFAVPMLSVPLFGDQIRNAALTKMHGLGLSLDKTKLTNESFYETVVKVLHDQTYKQRVTKLSAMLSDNLIDETEKGSFWISFYLRHPQNLLSPPSTNCLFIQRKFLQALSRNKRMSVVGCHNSIEQLQLKMSPCINFPAYFNCGSMKRVESKSINAQLNNKKNW
ncbi:UDPGT domain containing protein [Trichuris trichiura]|uniref:UDP-glucuronosyltransferase n=1 Tax=Trichuris trichiura TaxID=36087 RepID=A0A077Z5C4_TRITR|nr:UDPGT domain containing protein [Trichuris trichiura]